jgi:hypothetical protein
MAGDREDIVMRSAPEFDAQRALGRFAERASRERMEARPSWMSALTARASLASASLMRPVVAGVATVAILFAATVTGVAETILTVFEPQRIQTVQVDPRQLASVPDPGEYGTLTWISRPEPREVSDAAAAEAAAGFRPLAPAALPASVPATARFSVMPEAKATFQFDEAKARAAAARVNATLPPMPQTVAATTLTMTGGPGVMQQYGTTQIVQLRAPVVTSNGASVNELRDYALAQPGVPPSVAAQIRAIGDPVRTMLIPVGLDVGDAKPVSVRGTQGYLFGDDTGLGSGAVWLENGYVFAVMGPLKQADLLALVASLR